jgi:two-component system CheB/CheR fusion protein
MEIMNKREDLMPDKDIPAGLKSDVKFPVVGIGASAGGLDAFKRLLHALPEKSGMAYILVQHLDPSHESILPELLSRVTKIPVKEVTDNVQLEADNIYIIPSNKLLTATDGVLQLGPRPDKGTRNMPIDIFFSSLAEVHQAHAVGIVLSGTATDGTIGLKAIKEHGGTTFAQDQASAAYDGMPHSAIQAGVVDFVLPPELIPRQLMDMNIHFPGRSNGKDMELPLHEDEEIFKQILSVLHFRKGVDFTYYKQTTVTRRIIRRMALNKMDQPLDYLIFLKQNKQEQDDLYQDMLIPVTGFFRDSEIFEKVCTTVFPAIFKIKPVKETVRVWIAGCSTGEEAYSMAICLQEYLGEKNFAGKIQIFASDISETAITKARSGIYSKTELEGMSSSRLEKFFTKTNGNYQVDKELRNCCVFAVHNMLKDPPFARMDLISCRNVLIYMEPFLQKKAMTTFHYSLREDGFLLLGKSETVGSSSEMFAPFGKNDKIYTRRTVPAKFMLVTSPRREEVFRENNRTARHFESGRDDFQKNADELLLSRFTPAGVVVNMQSDILLFRGVTGPYLEPSPGKASLQLHKMIKEGLAFELRNLLLKAKNSLGHVIKEGIPLHENGLQRKVTIEILPLPNTIEPHFLILFTETQQTVNPEPKTKKGKKDDQDPRDILVKQLQDELAQLREDMRNITDDQEATNEELQSANEELLSGSEELQSLNEELETSKEELQSTNEELITVNHELIDRNVHLSNARRYAEAIVETVREPLVVLDKDFRVKNATAQFYKLFGVLQSETEGRSLFELGNNQWDIPALRTLMEKILPEKSMFDDFEVTHVFPGIGKQSVLLNARQIVRENDEQLILLAIEDVTEKKKVEEGLQVALELFKESDERLKIAIEATELGTFDYNPITGELFISERGKEFIGVSRDAKVSFEHFLDAIHPDDRERVEKIVYQTLDALNGGTFEIEYRVLDKQSNRLRWLRAKGHAFFNEDDVAFRFTGTLLDITNQRKSDEALKESESRFRTVANTAPVMIWMSGTDSHCTFFNKGWLEFTGRTYEEELKTRWIDRVHPLDAENCEMLYKAAFHARKGYHMEYRLRRYDGEYRWIYDSGVPRYTPEGIFEGFIGSCIDIQEQKMTREELEKLVLQRTDSLRTSNKNLERSNVNLEQFAYIASHDLQEPLRKIETFAERLEEKANETLSDDTREYLKKIASSASRMKVLINNLLDFSRLSSQAEQFVSTDLNTVLESAMADFDLLMDQKNGKIEFALLPVIEAIPLQMSQLFYNLISNSFKFSMDGKPPLIQILARLQVPHEESVEHGLSPDLEFCEIIFKDNGIGFSQEYADQIFTIFQRLHPRHLYPGTGIGLATCRKIVQNHQGKIYAESRENEGTEFHMLLPLRQK